MKYLEHHKSSVRVQLSVSNCKKLNKRKFKALSEKAEPTFRLSLRDDHFSQKKNIVEFALVGKRHEKGSKLFIHGPLTPYSCKYFSVSKMVQGYN